jgi:hypothetical protein
VAVLVVRAHLVVQDRGTKVKGRHLEILLLQIQAQAEPERSMALAQITYQLAAALPVNMLNCGSPTHPQPIHTLWGPPAQVA